jgi:hypothetical protein
MMTLWNERVNTPGGNAVKVARLISDSTKIAIYRYEAGKAIGEIHKVHVLSESYEGDGVHYRLRAPEAAIERIRAMLR